MIVIKNKRKKNFLLKDLNNFAIDYFIGTSVYLISLFVLSLNNSVNIYNALYMCLFIYLSYNALLTKDKFNKRGLKRHSVRFVVIIAYFLSFGCSIIKI